MEIQKILSKLEYNDGIFPKEALEAALERREEIIPELLRILRYGAKKANEIESDSKKEDYMLHIFSIYLLAQFREKEAYSIIAEYFLMPDETAFSLTGDLVTEGLGRIFASVSCGEDSLIKSIIEDRNYNEYVRSAAIDALVVFVASGEKTREEVILYFKELFTEKLERESLIIWSDLVACSVKLYPKEVLEEIKQAYEEELVLNAFITFEKVEYILKRGKDKVIEDLNKDPHYQLIDDTIAEIEGWSTYDNKNKEAIQTNRNSGNTHAKPVRTEPKISRNQPCPCGSGKKYKKCCGKN